MTNENELGPIVAGGVDLLEISRAEKTLSVRFPIQYREFLLSYGAAVVNGKSIYGLFEEKKDEQPMWIDLVKKNLRLRDAKQIGTENPTFIAISDDGQDVYYFLDTGIPEIKIYAIGPGVDKIVSTDLDHFINDYSGDWWG